MKLSDLFSRKAPRKDETARVSFPDSNRVMLQPDQTEPVSKPIPAAKHGSMIPRLLPRGNYGADILWVSPETDENGEPLHTRVPQEHTRTVHIAIPFRIGNFHYPNFRDFLRRRQPDSPFFMDSRGQRIFHYSERFPCFDSYDYLHDHRRYHWFYLFMGAQLVCVYYADESGILEITTDVAYIKEDCRIAMAESGFLR